MKLTLKEKAKLFWERNKADIIGWLVGAGVISAGICTAAYFTKKQIEKEEAEKERIAKELEEKRNREAQEAMDEDARDAADPANQLTGGGYIRPQNDNLYETDYPNALANCVPLSSMGEFGQDIIRRLNDEYPDWEETGYFNPSEAVADVWVDFGHEIWKLRNPEEESSESHEKQAS